MLSNSRKREILTKLGTGKTVLKEGVKEVGAGLKETFSGLMPGAKSGTQTVGEGVKKMWQGAKESVEPGLKAVGETFTGARIGQAKGARAVAREKLKGLTEAGGFRAMTEAGKGVKATDAEWKVYLKTTEGQAALTKWKASAGGAEVTAAQAAARKAGRKVWGERGITAGAYTGAAGAVGVPTYYAGKSRGKKSKR